MRDVGLQAADRGHVPEVRLVHRQLQALLPLHHAREHAHLHSSHMTCVTCQGCQHGQGVGGGGGVDLDD